MTGSDPAIWGVAPGHRHVRGDWIAAPEMGVEAALRAMGAWERPEGPLAPTTWVVRQADGLRVPFDASIETEDGGSAAVSGWVPPEALPLGYHRLIPVSGPPGRGGAPPSPVRLIVSPGACPVPRRSWGWAAQLYAARSRSSWGIGDLADLGGLVRWSASLGAGMVLVSPVHAVAPSPEQQSSPYFPASRRWRNPIYLRIEDVPGFGPDDDLDALATAGRALLGDRRIDRMAVWQLKRAALEQIWTRRRGEDAELMRWSESEGTGLRGFATWAALADEHGPDWRAWPTGLQKPDAPAVAEFATARADRVLFHIWVQWLLAKQWASATAETTVAVVSDLAVGVDPAGADAWQWQSVFAAGVSVGAPPDEFNPGGQDWGLPPFDPWRLRQAGYEPFIDIVRAAMAGGGGVRIDHVAGLFRLFWVPASGGPADGVYVDYPWADLLNVLALEASRSGAFVVGEDLGTIEPWVREALAEARVLSYRLAWFEDAHPSAWPGLALAAVTTHDLPTISGMWTGTDRIARESIGVTVDDDAEAQVQLRVVRLCGEEDIPVGEVVTRVYEALADSPALLVAATLDDVIEVDERPNMPGTIDEWPNWSIGLPLPLEDIERDERVLRLAHTFREARPPAS